MFKKCMKKLCWWYGRGEALQNTWKSCGHTVISSIVGLLQKTQNQFRGIIIILYTFYRLVPNLIIVGGRGTTQSTQPQRWRNTHPHALHLLHAQGDCGVGMH